jgi:hypothetical protein
LGTFNLLEDNPSGCQPCFCSGLGVTCSSAPGYIAANISTEFSSGLYGWSIVTENFTDHPNPDSVVATMPFSSGITILPSSAAFLHAPQTYLGSRLSSYLQFLTISLESLPGSETTDETSTLVLNFQAASELVLILSKFNSMKVLVGITWELIKLLLQTIFC